MFLPVAVGPGFATKIDTQCWFPLLLMGIWLENSYTVSGQSLFPFAIPWIFFNFSAMPLVYNWFQMVWQWNGLCAGIVEFCSVFLIRNAFHQNRYGYHLHDHHFKIQDHYSLYHQMGLPKNKIWINQFSRSWNEIKTFLLDDIYFTSLIAVCYEMPIAKVVWRFLFTSEVIVIH